MLQCVLCLYFTLTFLVRSRMAFRIRPGAIDWLAGVSIQLDPHRLLLDTRINKRRQILRFGSIIMDNGGVID